MTRIPLTAAGLALAALLAAAPGAHAANRFTLDPNPVRPGRVLLNPPGTAPGSALVAWTSAGAIPMVCVIPPGGGCPAPQTLAQPAGGDEIDGLFPVVSGSTVTLIGPRDASGDAVEWMSTGGAPFGDPTVVGKAYLNLTNPQDVVSSGATALIGADNPGLGIGGLGAQTGSLRFSDPGSDIATLGDGYGPQRNAMAAVGDDGQGIVSYIDGDGLEIADFAPLTPVASPPPVGGPVAGAAPRPGLRSRPRPVQDRLQERRPRRLEAAHADRLRAVGRRRGEAVRSRPRRPQGPVPL